MNLAEVEKPKNFIERIGSVRRQELLALAVTTPIALAALALDRETFGVSGPFQGHLLDLIGGSWSPMLFRTIAGGILQRRSHNTIIGIAPVSLAEFSQLINGVGIDPIENATFDPLDFLAYGGGILAWHFSKRPVELIKSGFRRSLANIINLKFSH